MAMHGDKRGYDAVEFETCCNNKRKSMQWWFGVILVGGGDKENDGGIIGDKKGFICGKCVDQERKIKGTNK